jgi:predicted SAM-dependent methyltransferase
VIYCSHVLEHVPDDRQALSEFRRVIKPGGKAIIVVPITGKRTFEDPSVTSPQERERLFGQHDHVRIYGPDVAERFRQAGFDVTALRRGDVLSAAQIDRMGITHDEIIFVLDKNTGFR